MENNKKQIMKKTCSMAKSMIKKAQELFEITQINMKIIQLKNKIERRFVKIGCGIYTARKQAYKEEKEYGNETTTDKTNTILKENENYEYIYKEIDELYEKITKLEEERTEIKRHIGRKKEQHRCGCKHDIAGDVDSIVPEKTASAEI